MAKLVLLSEGLTGRSHELTVEKTTVGRVDDNTFAIAEASVSSHHAEILLRGNDVVIKDLNSTNGTFINGEQVAAEKETVLKPGQILRLGKIEMRLETEASAAAAAPAKKAADQTLVIPRGVSLNEFDQGARGGFDTAGKGFTKKVNKVNKMFLIGGIIFGVIIIGLLVYIVTVVIPGPAK